MWAWESSHRFLSLCFMVSLTIGTKYKIVQPLLYRVWRTNFSNEFQLISRNQCIINTTLATTISNDSQTQCLQYAHFFVLKSLHNCGEQSDYYVIPHYSLCVQIKYARELFTCFFTRHKSNTKIFLNITIINSVV